ncbi:MAG: RluA family pseudouridine synthase [Desulfovibrio sp.]|nr:RluA family pseudouridine synthase [Desulfovibrio sp.]
MTSDLSSSHPDPPEKNGFYVQSTEAEQKLLSLLVRRLHLAEPLLHRWIRTGQIRRNGSRCKPFERISAGDFIRIPPFAWQMSRQVTVGPSSQLPPLPPEVGRHDGLIAYRKPAGLPTHSGTGHNDSLADRLAATFLTVPFVPVPAHRLDKDTSGLILVAASYRALQRVHAAFHEGGVVKEYVCWVHGSWPFSGEERLQDVLVRAVHGNTENMRIAEKGKGGKESVCFVRPLCVGSEKSLLLVRLLTGRTHQIRVQLSHRGFPLLGDRRYGRKDDGCPTLYLHAARITLPDGYVFTDLPVWDPPLGVTCLR